MMPYTKHSETALEKSNSGQNNAFTTFTETNYILKK